MEITIKLKIEQNEAEPCWGSCHNDKLPLPHYHPKAEESYKLCYVRDPWAWFTTQPVTEQWGDDWDDTPYEHNAGSPYDGDTWKIKKVSWEGPFEEPCEGHQNSPYSVKQLNHGIYPWLMSDSWCDPEIKVWAGISLTRFIQVIREAGGQVYQ